MYIVERIFFNCKEAYYAKQAKWIDESMGQIANTQYIYNTLYAKWGTSFQPAAGTATQAANCEYLLKMVDKANGNSTSYGTGSYATKQVVDTVAVNDAVNRLIVPGGKFVVLTGGSKVVYSTDGINWIETTIPSRTNCYSVIYGGD
jgi:hypothetical protein